MKTSLLQRRLTRLEAQGGINADPPPLVIVKYIKSNGQFGAAPCESDRAEANGQVWRREPGETSPDFESRVIANLPKREHLPTILTFSPRD